jgi:hypothetical protein
MSLCSEMCHWETGTSSGTYGQSEELVPPRLGGKPGSRNQEREEVAARTVRMRADPSLFRTLAMRTDGSDAFPLLQHSRTRHPRCGSPMRIRLFASLVCTYSFLGQVRYLPTATTTAPGGFDNHYCTLLPSIPTRIGSETLCRQALTKKQRDSATPYRLQFRSPFPRVARDRW